MTMPPTYPGLLAPEEMDPTGVYDPQTNVADVQEMTDPAIGVLQQTMQEFIGPTHQEAGPSQANETVAPNPPDQLELIPQDEQKRLLAAALYGGSFPAILGSERPEDWASWVRGLWASHVGAVTKHLYLCERNRLFRAGQQWVSSRGTGPWREPLKPVDSTRAVYNLIDKALDQRLQIQVDQRPGFRVEPVTFDPEDKKKAQARQRGLEYQYDQQEMDAHREVAGFWAQTDGVAFWQSYWDPQAGPWDERMGQSPDAHKPLGDLRTRTLRAEQVRVSANASKTDAPYYVIIREVIPATESAYQYGMAGVRSSGTDLTTTGAGDAGEGSGTQRWVLDQTTVGEGDRLRDQDVVERFWIYVDRQSEVLPDGLEMIVVGDQVIWGPGPLLFKVIPVVDVRDGSTDPSYYPRPIMEQWLDHQVRINALTSAIVDSIRVNKGGRFVSRPGAVVQETFVGGGTSIIEVNGGVGTLDDILKPIAGFSIGQDVKDQLQNEITAFENASGYNDQSRGQIAGDASGRAILAAREQLERVFAPGVKDAARAFTKWAKIQIAGMAFGYDVPRDLGATGNGRPDLARQLTKQEFDGPCDVKVDPETLMPMPRVYKQFLLDGWLDRGLITPQQYMRRQASAMTDDMETPDEDQNARAQRIAEAIRLRQPVPEMRWQDNEAIHQDVLEREIILQDDLAPDIIAAAQQRWADLSYQSMQKQGGAMPPPQAGPAGNAGGPSPSGGAPTNPNPPGTQPLATGNPSAGSAPPLGGPMAPGMAGATQQHDTAAQFESMSPQ